MDTLSIVVSIEDDTSGDVGSPEVLDSLAHLLDLVSYVTGQDTEFVVKTVAHNYYVGDDLIANFDELVEVNSLWWFVRTAVRDFQTLLNSCLDHSATVLIL